MREKIEWTKERFDESVKYLLGKNEYKFEDLELIVEMLRCPYGCPWDREQTHETIRANMIEEAYELCEGIDKNDVELMKEESGDVILQSVFHGVIGKYNDEYTIDDTLDEVCKKLISRHPHVFGDVEAKTSAKVLENWDKIKSDSKGRKTVAEKMESIPTILPALMRANKVGEKSSKLKFDYNDKYDSGAKVAEELNEVMNADAETVAEEVGDLLFAAVCLSRMLGVEPEKALNDATDKFIGRFKIMETLISEENISQSELTESLLLEKWAIAKRIFAEKKHETSQK